MEILQKLVDSAAVHKYYFFHYLLYEDSWQFCGSIKARWAGFGMTTMYLLLITVCSADLILQILIHSFCSGHVIYLHKRQNN